MSVKLIAPLIAGLASLAHDLSAAGEGRLKLSGGEGSRLTQYSKDSTGGRGFGLYAFGVYPRSHFNISHARLKRARRISLPKCRGKVSSCHASTMIPSLV